MTVMESNAANKLAREIIVLAASGAPITPVIQISMALFMIKAHKRLRSGFTDATFLETLGRARHSFESDLKPDADARERLAAIDQKLRLDRHWHWLTLEEARFLREQLRLAEYALAESKKMGEVL